MPKINTIKRGGSRFYVHPDDGTKAVGVTSVVGMLPKDFLRYWAAKSVAEGAVANIGAIVTLAMNDPAAAVDMLKRTPDRDTRQAAETGTEAHAIFEKMVETGNLHPRVHPDYEPYAEHFRAFLAECQPEYTMTEETVWSEAHGYAGSFDALATISGEPVWLDYKTTRSGVHEDVALQLSAYAHADYVLRPDGSRIPLPKVESGAVLHVRPEGWKLVPVRIDDEIFGTFLHLLAVHAWERGGKGSVLGNPVAGSQAA